MLTLQLHICSFVLFLCCFIAKYQPFPNLSSLCIKKKGIDLAFKIWTKLVFYLWTFAHKSDCCTYGVSCLNRALQTWACLFWLMYDAVFICAEVSELLETPTLFQCWREAAAPGEVCSVGWKCAGMWPLFWAVWAACAHYCGWIVHARCCCTVQT